MIVVRPSRPMPPWGQRHIRISADRAALRAARPRAEGFSPAGRRIAWAAPPEDGGRSTPARSMRRTRLRSSGDGRSAPAPHQESGRARRAPVRRAAPRMSQRKKHVALASASHRLPPAHAPGSHAVVEHALRAHAHHALGPRVRSARRRTPASRSKTEPRGRAEASCATNNPASAQKQPRAGTL